jgi:hypothetical protein
MDNDLGGLKLYKWALIVKRFPQSQWEAEPFELFISAQLLQIIESQTLRKVLVHADLSVKEEGGLLVGVEKPTIDNANGRPSSGYSTQTFGTAHPQCRMEIHRE